MAAATSILLRANEAVAKEQRLAAVIELQNRVEDWKGHQIDHFGDLMLFGTFTVLKGEGAKEVEREVRDIFLSLSPDIRKQMRYTYGQNRSLSLLSSPMRSPLVDCRSGALVSEDLDRQELANPNLYTSARLDPNLHTKAVLERTLSGLQSRVAPSSKRFVSGLEGVPEEVNDERSEDASKETSSNAPLASLGDVKQALPNPSRQTLRKMASKPTFYAKSSLGTSPSPLQSPSAALWSPCSSPPCPAPPPREGSSSEGSSAPPTPSRSSKGSSASKLSDFSSKVRASKRILKAVFKKTKPVSFTSSDLHLFNGPFMHGNHFLVPRGGHLPKWPPPSCFGSKPIVPMKPKITEQEKELIEELKLIRPVRIQYKVYLFERILLCCKEVNPNKPKNKMLGNTKPLVDKKGKPRLQLKGRIFMQNVTDVISVNRSSSYLTLDHQMSF